MKKIELPALLSSSYTGAATGNEELVRPLDPASAIFIGDSENNVRGAWETGMQAIHFTSPEELERELKELGAWF